MTIIQVANAWPSFKKIAPISSAIQQNKEQDTHSKIESLWVHTLLPNGQTMPRSFFEDLEPFYDDLNLKTDSRGYSEQPGKAMIDNCINLPPVGPKGFEPPTSLQSDYFPLRIISKRIQK